MKIIRNIFILMLSVIVITACDDLFKPLPENLLEKDAMYENASFAEGLIAGGYSQLPINNYHFNDVATDDAVSNDINNGYLRMATGEWTSGSYISSNNWVRYYNPVLYMNTIIEESDKVNWAADPILRKFFSVRLKGEAYGLRAIYYYLLIREYSGYVDGELLGVPLILTQQDNNSDFNIPRATFKENVAQIYADLDSAELYLPDTYVDLTDGVDKVPNKYLKYGADDDMITEYNHVFGVKFAGRMNAVIAKAVRAQVAALAASPAFLDGSENTWQYAAESAGAVLELNNGLAGLNDSKAVTWYADQSTINNLSQGANPNDIIWRTTVGNNRSLESEHYPPSLYGNGRVNPTQNLVNAFPAINGYPITDPNSGYDKDNPYQNRDPRLKKYIVYDRSNFGPGSPMIAIASGSNNDRINREQGKSTRTGYYMRKLMKETTNLSPTNPNEESAYFARMRFTEIYLIYAEAANEAYGPQGSAPNVSYSAYDVIKKLRERAGITGGDAYLESIKSDKNAMRELIRNERRLELCFEGHRFWDLRRWNLDLNEPARGIGVTDDGKVDLGPDGLGYVVETRDYKDYMRYSPIPLSETLKWDNYKQNTGWR